MFHVRPQCLVATYPPFVVKDAWHRDKEKEYYNLSQTLLRYCGLLVIMNILLNK